MTLNINLTRRVRRRKLKSGAIVEQIRYVLNWRDPRTGEREQRFFERQREAQERRAELVAAYERGVYSSANQDRNRRGRRRGVARDEARRRPADHLRDAMSSRSRYVVGPLRRARRGERSFDRASARSPRRARSSSSAASRSRS